jgi:hypothetical protein
MADGLIPTGYLEKTWAKAASATSRAKICLLKPAPASGISSSVGKPQCPSSMASVSA